MSHLTSEELANYRDLQSDEAERARIAAHLVVCESCRRSFADAIKMQPATESSRFAPAPFVERGLRAYPSADRAWWRGFVVWVGVPAAAAILIAVLLPMRSTFRDPSDTTRGTALVPEVPAGRIESLTELRWSSPITASRFVVTVRDASGAAVFTTQSRTTRAVADVRLGEGTYSWTVEALDASGRVLAVSPPVGFEIRRR